MPDVTGITALDVTIGLAFVYLLFSILCSAVQEAIAGVLDLRARDLEKGLQNLLDDRGKAADGGARLNVLSTSSRTLSADEEPLSRKVLSHGLIRTQYRESRWWSPGRERRGPSYISSKVFVLALLDIVERDDPASTPDVSLVTRIDQAAVPAGTKDALLALAKGVGDDRERLRQRVEDWFNAGMDRVSGWYKRKAQIIICVLAAAVTVGLNVNTIAIADRLVRDDAVRATVVAAATNTKLEPGSALDPVLKEIGDTGRLGLPIGWHKEDSDPASVDLQDHFGRTVGGWFITFVMLSLGAPFWFGLLGRLVSLRSSGVRPEPAKAA